MRIEPCDDGVWRIAFGDAPALDIRPRVDTADGPVSLRHCGNGLYEGEGVRLEVELRPAPDAVEAILRLRADGGRTVAFAGVECGPLNLAARHRFFGTAPGFLEKKGVAPALDAQADGRVASMLGVLADPEGVSLLAGLGAPGNADPSAFWLADDRLRAGFRPERDIADECEVKLFLSAKPDAIELLEDYGQRMAGFGRCGSAVPTGWNSWDFYGGAVRMEDLGAEMAALAELPFRDRLQYLTLDMGWEEDWGDWTPNRKFPADLGEIAGRIRAAGWRPGIWTAPLQVSMFTPLARHRPELFARNADGGLVIDQDSPRGPVLLLDCSLPEARELLHGWFAGMRQAGFDLFKIDYLYESYLRQCGHNAGGLGRTAFARLFFRAIRDAVGDGAHIVNCGGSKEAALGLVDSARVTVDIHNFWGHIRNNAQQLAHAFWMNRRLWINDPDFAIARHSGNCTARHKNMPYTRRPLASPADFWMRGPEASAEEMRLWLSVVRLNGGSLFLADSIRTLTEEGRAELGRLFPPLEGSFVPLDLFERERPSVWLSRDPRRPTLGLFNWEDTPQELPLPASLGGAVTGRDFWSGLPVQLSDAARLAPRSGMLVDL